MKTKIEKKNQRIKRVRSRVNGTAERPRLSVHKSNRFIYAQIINDEKGITLVSAKGTKGDEVGKAISKLAKSKKIKKAVFDKRSYKYHGQVKALADSAREGGLEF